MSTASNMFNMYKLYAEEKKRHVVSNLCNIFDIVSC